jgi:hypothetical protein
MKKPDKFTLVIIGIIIVFPLLVYLSGFVVFKYVDFHSPVYMLFCNYNTGPKLEEHSNDFNDIEQSYSVYRAVGMNYYIFAKYEYTDKSKIKELPCLYISAMKTGISFKGWKSVHISNTYEKGIYSTRGLKAGFSYTGNLVFVNGIKGFGTFKYCPTEIIP